MWICTSSNISTDWVAMFLSFPGRNTLHTLAVAYLIINTHVYSGMPGTKDTHSHYFIQHLSPAICSLLLVLETLVLTNVPHQLPVVIFGHIVKAD